MPNADHDEFWRYTGPKRAASALNTLHGLVQGLIADDVIKPPERETLRQWLAEHEDLTTRRPFADLCAVAKRELLGRVAPPSDVLEDIRETCQRLVEFCGEFDQNTSDKQVLHGFVSGIAADAKVLNIELQRLRDWLNEHEHLSGYWPFDEVNSVVRSVLADGVIDDEEHSQLLQFFSSFTRHGESRALDIPFNEMHKPLSGICAHCPEITLTEKSFCITGASSRGPRSFVREQVEQCGGSLHNKVLKSTDYLVVCADGNEAWAYQCYGRKIEKAMQMRKSGSGISIVHEFDFWDAIDDSE